MKDEKSLSINVVEAIRKVPSPSHTPEEIKSYGFDGVILDYIDARNEIKDLLCVSCHVHDVPVLRSGGDVNRLDGGSKNRLDGDNVNRLDGGSKNGNVNRLDVDNVNRLDGGNDGEEKFKRMAISNNRDKKYINSSGMDNNNSINGIDNKKKYISKMEDLPNDVDELNLLIRTEVAQLKFINVDEDIQNEMDVVEKELGDVEKELSELECCKSDDDKIVNEIRSEVCENVEEIVKCIGIKFGELFSKIGEKCDIGVGEFYEGSGNGTGRRNECIDGCNENRSVDGCDYIDGNELLKTVLYIIYIVLIKFTNY
ncbi:chromosome segregation atpase [Vairimorpha apis BRL 01]|uniref:Chromosome segregation atpase n=1 Tax=Vairimorpha apis BRL 01 TaxID=1037528 RepID=T0MBS3_9MICR|nr:chromosome segregation atpase [Vairimorpha apis BRL 01]